MTTDAPRPVAGGDLDFPQHLPEEAATEIVVHSVGGSAPAAMLDDATVKQITGDSTAGMWRGQDGTTSNHTTWHRVALVGLKVPSGRRVPGTGYAPTSAAGPTAQVPPCPDRIPRSRSAAGSPRPTNSAAVSLPAEGGRAGDRRRIRTKNGGTVRRCALELGESLLAF